MKFPLAPRRVVLIAFDTTLIVTAVAIAAYVRLGDQAWDIAVNENGIVKAIGPASVDALE